MRWYTCTPIRFPGDHTFFARDSGLLCKGFQQIGIESKAIMPGPEMENDQTEDLIRTDYRNLEDPVWWRGLNGEGVVFYGWGAGKYTKIARAIKQADMRLVSHMDTAGILGILNGLQEYSRTLMAVCEGESDNAFLGKLRFLLRFTYASSVGILKNDLTRAQHLKQADLIGAITPIAQKRIQKVCGIYGGASLQSKVRLIPHPCSPSMTFDPSVMKEHLVVAAGRWDDHRIKGTHLLMSTLEQLLRQDSICKSEIYGTLPDFLLSWHQQLPVDIKSRITLGGRVRNEQLAGALQRARVSLCTSLRESYHIASAEALCCGCSIVGPDTPELPSMEWFTQDGCGTLTPREPAKMAQALAEELHAWENNLRSPHAISSKWCQQLHAPQVAKKILDLL